MEIYSQPKSINILGMKVDMVQTSEVIKIMENWIRNKEYGNYIVISNANDSVISKQNREVRQAVNNSSLSVPDGISLVLLARLYGYSLKKRVYGPDLMLEFLKTTSHKNYSHFFYGATDNVLTRLISNLKQDFPNLKVAGVYSPPFRSLTRFEDNQIVTMINAASADILWVGLGCPKQQLWMYRHQHKLKVPVMVGVGAAFDFLAKLKPQAPRFIRDNGFEWLFRFVSEPKRLWKRYLVNGSLFLYYGGKQIVNDFLLKKTKQNQ